MSRDKPETPFEVAMDRAEFAAKEAEEAAFTLAMWMADWRRRHPKADLFPLSKGDQPQ